MSYDMSSRHKDICNVKLLDIVGWAWQMQSISSRPSSNSAWPEQMQTTSLWRHASLFQTISEIAVQYVQCSSSFTQLSQLRVEASLDMFVHCQSSHPSQSDWTERIWYFCLCQVCAAFKLGRCVFAGGVDCYSGLRFYYWHVFSLDIWWMHGSREM